MLDKRKEEIGCGEAKIEVRNLHKLRKGAYSKKGNAVINLPFTPNSHLFIFFEGLNLRHQSQKEKRQTWQRPTHLFTSHHGAIVSPCSAVVAARARHAGPGLRSDGSDVARLGLPAKLPA